LSLATPVQRRPLRLPFLSQLSDYFELTGDVSRLDEGIEYGRAMIGKLGRVERELRPVAELFLARLLEQRALIQEPLDDAAMDEAERLLRRACADAADADQRSMCWFSLARLLRARYERAAGGAPDARGSLDACRVAAESAPALSPQSASLAIQLGVWAAEDDAADEAAHGFRTALSAARRLSTMGMVRSQKELPLPGVGGVAAEAMYWLLKSGRPREAVLALEMGRALVLTDMIERDTLVRRLGEHDPSLAAYYSGLTLQLAQAELDSSLEPLAGPNPLTHLNLRLEQARTVRALRDEWEALAIRLRRMPEFQALVAEPTYDQLQDAVRQVPLLYLAAAERTGYALLVTAARDAPEVVELPDLTRTDLDDVVDSYRDAAPGRSDPWGASDGNDRWHEVLDDTLHWLHDAVIGPVTAELRLSGQVALVPVGPLALLPVHAAGGYADPAGANDITWTYTPNGRILARHARLVAARDGGSRGVLLTLDDGRGGNTLRMAPAVESAVRAHAPEVTVLGPGEATGDAVLTALRHHDLYHFNCHGQADPEDPFASYLQLADRALTIRDLLRQRLPGRLAILSACETAMARHDLPDEVVSLPGALLEAGVPGVIASMWEVDEMATFLLTARFYELWGTGGYVPPTALRLAQCWLRSSTVEQFDSYLRTNGLGRWPRRYGARIAARKLSEHIYRHPDYWAAFTYTGV
jgi:CHAT domain-containing protein